MFEIKEIPIRDLRTNNGEVEGLSCNPRKISKKQLEKLKKSLKDAPEMLRLRELIVVPHGGQFVVIAGNQRLEAAKSVGMETLPCKVLPADTDPAKLREYAIKDNLPFGEDDWEVIASDWDAAELEDWGMVIPEECRDLFEINRIKKKEWSHNSEEILCDMVEKPTICHREEFDFIHLYKRSKEGIPLKSFKTDSFVGPFADSVSKIIFGLLGVSDKDVYAIVSTPARRNKEWNFADMVCKKVSSITGITYIEEFATAKNRQRIEPTFEKNRDIQQPNVIIIDDIFTTGSTVKATKRLLKDKNVVIIVGINNN